MSRLFDVLWLLAFGLASSLWCLTAAPEQSAVFDEPFYLQAGLERWHTGSYRPLLRKGTMPLPIDAQTLPLYLWEMWRGQAFDPVADFGTILPVARAANLVFWWLLLLYGWLLARHLGGPWAGRLSVALLALEPSLLGHASLAVTDIAITATLLALIYHFAVGRERGWWWRVGVPALWFGLAVLAKASGLVFGPLCLFVLELHRLYRAGRLPLWSPRQLWTATASSRRDLAWIGGLGLSFAFVYCGSDWQPEPSFVAWAATLPEGASGDAMRWLADHLRIFSNAGHGLVYQIKHNLRGHDGTFLLGEWYPRAVWYYFPVALAIKLSLPVLLLALVALVLRPRTFFGPAGLLVVVLFLFSLNCRVQLGVRMVFPLFALLLVAVAVALASLRLPGPAWVPRLAGGAVLAACTVPTLMAWPHGLCFVNQLWGGTERGHQLLGEWNFDCGQGLVELARWQADHPERAVHVWYYGTDPRVGSWLHHLPLHTLPIRSPDEVAGLVGEGYLAVAANLVHGHPCLPLAGRLAAEAVRGRQPVARTTTFFIFDLGEGGRLRVEGQPGDRFDVR